MSSSKESTTSQSSESSPQLMEFDQIQSKLSEKKPQQLFYRLLNWRSNNQTNYQRNKNNSPAQEISFLIDDSVLEQQIQNNNVEVFSEHSYSPQNTNECVAQQQNKIKQDKQRSRKTKKRRKLSELDSSYQQQPKMDEQTRKHENNFSQQIMRALKSCFEDYGIRLENIKTQPKQALRRLCQNAQHRNPLFKIMLNRDLKREIQLGSSKLPQKIYNIGRLTKLKKEIICWSKTTRLN